MKINHKGREYDLDYKTSFRHLRQAMHNNEFYRDMSRGRIAGVCAGLAQRFRMSTTAMRAIFVVAWLGTGFFPMLIAYAIAAFFMEDVSLLELKLKDQMVAEAAASGDPADRILTSRQLVEKFEKMDKSLQKMESFVISPQYEWLQKYKKLET